ncbi:hypothetical protein ABZ569_16740 [Streptomyces albus]|uniref:hypothetical protein n=1 Tax=Streptomyces albus TaxID=1888 RepID=UPI0033D76BF9
MSSLVIQKSEEDLKRILTETEGYIAEMGNAGRTVADIVERVEAHYTADSSRVFREEVNKWIEWYNKITASVNQLHSDLTQANHYLDSNELEQIHQASGWMGDVQEVAPADDVERVLG